MLLSVFSLTRCTEIFTPYGAFSAITPSEAFKHDLAGLLEIDTLAAHDGAFAQYADWKLGQNFQARLENLICGLIVRSRTGLDS